MARGGLVAVAGFLSVSLAACLQAPEHSTPEVADANRATSVPTVLILDGSSSMIQAEATGARIDAAKAAAKSLVDALPDGSMIGLETYGTEVGSAEADKSAGCLDVTVLLPLGTVDRAAIHAAIDGINPSGYTPISLALQRAVEQLPADGESQAVVLVSDGEDTCSAPPCETAVQLKHGRPNLTISTIGFKVDGQAAEQLRCVADSTGGLFVRANNASQLAARLLATRDLGAASTALSPNGRGGINVGAKMADIRAKYSDFPDAAESGRVVVTWRDCDFGFTDGVLQFIAPRGGGRTIDGVTVGTSLANAVDLYGRPLATTSNSDGTTSVIFDADPDTPAAYRLDVIDFSDDNGSLSGTVTAVVLCLCKPRSGVVNKPEEVVLKPVDAQGNLQSGFAKVSGDRGSPIDCFDGIQSPYDVTSGVLQCGFPVDSGDACWPTGGGRWVLCLTDPFRNVLTLRPATGVTTVQKQRSYPLRPMGLLLDDGTQCRARTGGSWPRLGSHPDWVGYFQCSGEAGRPMTAVWGPGELVDGIRREPAGWTVQVGSAEGTLATRNVLKAYYVGVA